MDVRGSFSRLKKKFKRPGSKRNPDRTAAVSGGEKRDSAGSRSQSVPHVVVVDGGRNQEDKGRDADGRQTLSTYQWGVKEWERGAGWIPNFVNRKSETGHRTEGRPELRPITPSHIVTPLIRLWRGIHDGVANFTSAFPMGGVSVMLVDKK